MQALAVIAAAQHGLFTREQAIAAGYPLSTIGVRLKTNAWLAVDYGVYRTATTTTTWQQRVLAACLSGSAVASHRSAAHLWHIPIGGETPVEVTAFRHRRRSKRTDIIWHESVRLEPYERRIIDGIPVTEPVRTVLDLAGLGDELLVLRAVDDLVRRKMTSLSAIYTRVDQLGEFRRGSDLVRKVLRRRSGRVPESVTETDFSQLLHRAGLPAPVRQFEVRDGRGRLVGRVDFAYPREGILIEVQSVRFHDGPDERQQDDRRHARLAALGYRVLPIRGEDVRDDPDSVVAIIRDALSNPSSMRS